MKKLILITLFFSLSACRNHIDEYTIVKSVSSGALGGKKYRIELDFFLTNQYLYTDSLFNVGDTLTFKKRRN